MRGPYDVQDCRSAPPPTLWPVPFCRTPHRRPLRMRCLLYGWARPLGLWDFLCQFSEPKVALGVEVPGYDGGMMNAREVDDHVCPACTGFLWDCCFAVSAVCCHQCHSPFAALTQLGPMSSGEKVQRLSLERCPRQSRLPPCRSPLLPDSPIPVEVRIRPRFPPPTPVLAACFPTNQPCYTLPPSGKQFEAYH